LNKEKYNNKKEKNNGGNENSKENWGYKNDNFCHLQKSKIDGNYKTKNKNINETNKNNTKNNNEKIKKYKTPIRRIYQTSLNSISKYKKYKNKNAPVTPSLSFYNDISSISYKQIENNDGCICKKRKSKTELLDSIINDNKSYIFNKSNNFINRSHYNINQKNNIIYNSGNNSNNKKQNYPCTSSLKKNIKFSNIRQKNKTNLFLEQFIDKEKMSNDNYKFIFNKNYGDWLTSEDGEDILICISNIIIFYFYCICCFGRNLWNSTGWEVDNNR
jgi:hypothetical protein